MYYSDRKSNDSLGVTPNGSVFQFLGKEGGTTVGFSFLYVKNILCFSKPNILIIISLTMQICVNIHQFDCLCLDS